MSISPDACRPSMLRRRRPGPAKPMSFLQEDYSMSRQTVSVICSVLPLAIQSRLPPLLSRPTTPSGGGYADKAWNSSTSSGATTPFTEADTLVSDEDGGVETLDFAAADVRSRPDTGALQRPAPGSGIEWRCGRPGLELLISAVDESKNGAVLRSGHVSSHDAGFERRAYLDGVSYLLRGLPQDLDENEMSILRRALPCSVAGTQTDARGQLGYYSGQEAHVYSPPSVLQTSMRAIVARAIVWFCILWPYILVLLRWAAAYEKKHRISEQVVAQGTALVTACGKWAVSISQAVFNRGDGKLGRALAETVAWTVHDMIAGVSEGVQDGLSQVG